MNVVYLSDTKSGIQKIDNDILFSLKKTAEVKVLDIRKLNLKRAIKDILNADVFLFHATMGQHDRMLYYQILENLKVLIEGSNAKKVLWLFDKIWQDKLALMLEFYNSVDAIFVSDETWLRRFDSEKIFPLHPAASEKRIKGKFKKELACDIAYVGNIYGGREDEAKFLRDKFGGRVKFFNDRFGKDFADLCKSAKIIVVPKYPFDDFFWSERIYKILSCGGFCLHPRAYGLAEQGFKDGEHYMTYNTEQELHVSLMGMLDKRADKARKQIAKQGQEFVLSRHTYSERISEILSKI